jgi:hypothetical protein
MKFNKLFFLITMSSLMGLSSSCNLQGEPEQALREFINYRVSNGQQKNFYIKSTSGKMLDFYERMTEDEFNKYISLKKIINKKLKVNLKKCSDKACSITYTISFYSEGVKKSKVETEVKKIAELVKEDGNWKIADILNIKSHFEFKDSITP